MISRRDTPPVSETIRRHTLALAVTNRCPLRCDFCCVPPGPGDLERELVLDLIDQTEEIGTFRSIGFTGGEPLIRRKLVLEAGARARSKGLRWGLTTGMGWARDSEHATKVAAELAESGLTNITVSVDASHLDQRDARPVERFISACDSAHAQVNSQLHIKRPHTTASHQSTPIRARRVSLRIPNGLRNRMG